MKNLFPVLLLFLYFHAQGQDKMEVIRCEAVDRSSPVTNIFIDEAAQIWVGNRKGLNRVYAPDNGELVKMPASEWSLLQTHDGNADIRLPLSELITQMGADGQAIASREDRITAAIYDASKGDLWVGTAQSGLFQFEIEPSLKLVEQHHTGNSKLNSDQINTLFLDRAGRLWIGTAEGACFGRYGKWQLEERYFNITAFAEKSTGEVWVMGNDQLWRVDARQRWNPIDIEQARIVEGDVADIAFDNEDRLWVASEIVARYDTETEEAKIFGPAQEFTSQDVFQITVDDKNVAWIGTNDKGLYIIQKAATLYVSAQVTKPLDCNDPAATAELSVAVDGGTEPYTYKWTGGATGQNPTGLQAGEYRLTVTDARRKEGRTLVKINDPTVSLEVKMDKPASPDGATDGVATVTATGGEPDYTFSWDNGETTPTATKLAAGKYSVRVTDQLGCESVAEVNIEGQIGALNVSISQTKENPCAEANEAALKVEVNGGKGPFTFAWNASGANGDAPQNLPAGQYETTVTDATGQTATAALTVSAPPAISAKVKIDAPATTGNEDGRATVSAEGGTNDFKYQWSNGGTAAKAVNFGPGDHAVTVTDANGCTAVATFTISENILDLAVALAQTAEVKCAGGTSGAVKAEVSGGKGPFSFAWSSASANGGAATSLASGDHEVTVTDASGKSASAKIALKEPKALELKMKVDAPASTGNADGKATVKASGGVGEYLFKWENGETNESAVQLAPGDHSVTVTDENGCTATASVNISENILPLSVSISPTAEIKCAEAAEAVLVAEVSGGKPGFQFAWSGTTEQPFDADGKTASRMAAGKYTVTVTDETGATATADYEIKAPKPLEISAKADAPASTGNADGKASVKASGGTGDLKFTWSGGGTGDKLDGLAPGDYTVTVTDANGCTATATVNISENILPLSVSISPTAEIKCAESADGALTAEPNGGKGPYQYEWSSGATQQNNSGLKSGNYMLTLTDAEGTSATAEYEIRAPKPFDISAKADAPASTGNADGKASAKASGGTGDLKFTWSSGSTGDEVDGLAPGDYTVTVTDANGCTATAMVNISENILPLSVSISPTAEIKCADETNAALVAEPNGGKPGFTFLWSDGVNGAERNNLAAGKYTLTLTDAEGTSATADYEIRAPKPLDISAKADAPASTGNADGKASAKASGGTGDLKFNWSGGGTGDKLDGLAPGEYTVTVTDENGCTATSTVSISENILPLTVSISPTAEIKCAESADGALTAEPSGGKGPYQYEWSSGATQQSAFGLKPDNYYVTLTDVEGTTATANVKISAPAPITVELPKNRPATTNETKNGKAELKATGGTGEFTFVWDNGETGVNAVELGAGIHSVTVTDANGCEEVVKIETKTRINPELEAGRLRTGQLVKLDKIYFPPDSTTLDPESIPTLEELLEFMQDNEGISIEVGGHTNGIPEHAFCDQLSTERAKSVAQWLVDNGLPANRLTYKGYGKRKPVATNSTPEGRAKNQRVEVKIVSLE